MHIDMSERECVPNRSRSPISSDESHCRKSENWGHPCTNLQFAIFLPSTCSCHHGHGMSF